MAGRVVTRAVAHFGALTVTLTCFACSDFDPVEVQRFALLHPGNDDTLGITGAKWVAYDDQHSLTSACTNGASGDHDPDECSSLYQPSFGWPGPRCLQGPNDLSKGYIEDTGPYGPICIQGVLRPYAKCKTPPEQCARASNGKDLNESDTSNMWGVGVGLAFTSNGQGWNADLHDVVGVAFDLSGIEPAKLGAKALNVRVEVPTVLPGETPLFSAADPSSILPVMRDDGAVIGTDGKLYRAECDPAGISKSDLDEDRNTGTLQDVVSGNVFPEKLLTSELHPLGSPFWQAEDTSAWRPSPIQVGHNEFKWKRVLPPKDAQYEFDRTRIVGIHFQVAHGDPSNQKDLNFSFCISNLAFLMK